MPPSIKNLQLCIYPWGGVHPHNNIKQQTAGLRAAGRSWNFSLISVMSVYFAWRYRGAKMLKGWLSAEKKCCSLLQRKEEGTEAMRSWVKEMRESKIESQKTTRIRDGRGVVGGVHNKNEVRKKLERSRNSLNITIHVLASCPPLI